MFPGIRNAPFPLVIPQLSEKQHERGEEANTCDLLLVTDRPKNLREKKELIFFNTTHVPIQHVKYDPKLPTYFEIYARP